MCSSDLLSLRGVDAVGPDLGVAYVDGVGYVDGVAVNDTGFACDVGVSRKWE